MPKYRKLHVKTVESLDLNDMPDDFTRLAWVLLPLVLCREGRGVYNAAWIKSKLFPLRIDVTLSKMKDAMVWWVERGMIKVYSIEGREYFYIPTWSKYQADTSKEADSPYPDPLQTNSGVSIDEVKSKFPLSEYESESEFESVLSDETDYRAYIRAFCVATGIKENSLHPKKIDDSIKLWVKNELQPDDITKIIEGMLAKSYSIANTGSITQTAINVYRSSRNGKPKEEYHERIPGQVFS